MYTAVREQLVQELSGIQAQGLWKAETIITSPQGAEIQVGGRTLLNFCANNYLGLSAHPEVLAAARRAFPALVAGDQKEFGAQFPDFAAAPRQVLSGALRQARADAKIQAEFTGNLLPLVYGGGTPAFAQAFGDFNAVTEALLEVLP